MRTDGEKEALLILLAAAAIFIFPPLLLIPLGWGLWRYFDRKREERYWKVKPKAIDWDEVERRRTSTPWPSGWGERP